MILLNSYETIKALLKSFQNEIREVDFNYNVYYDDSLRIPSGYMKFKILQPTKSN